MIQIAQPNPRKRNTALARLKQARRSGVAFKPSPSVHPQSPCYILTINKMSESLGVKPDTLKSLLNLIGIEPLPGDLLLEPDTTLALRTATRTGA
jgi:hypothetical protein